MSVEEDIEKLRTKIDEINDQIIDMIARRTEIGDKIGELKKKNEISAYQPDREEEIIKKCQEKAREERLDAEAIKEIFKKIISISRSKQMEDEAK